MADEVMAADLEDMITAGGVTIHRYSGPVSAMLGLFEDVASIIPLDESGVPCAIVESNDETVRSAVADTLDRYRDRAKQVSVEGKPQ